MSFKSTYTKHKAKEMAKLPIPHEIYRNISIFMYFMRDGMIYTPSSFFATEFSKQLAIMTAIVDHKDPARISERTDPVAISLMAALATVANIEKRFERTGKWGVSGDEAQSIRDIAAVFDDELTKTSYVLYESARVFVTDLLEKQDVQH